MANPVETYDEQRTDQGRIARIPAKWVIVLTCSLIILFVGIFASYQQKLSAGATPTAPLALIPLAGGQVPAPENVARGNDKLATKPSIWPTSGEVTSGFGWRVSPFGGGSEFHPGLDIANAMDTPIVATADGVVVQSGWNDGYGNIVTIDHGNGIKTLYGHNSRIAVQVGQSVKKGQVIAYLGSTGRSTGPHAHYEVRVNDNAVDPISFLVH